MIANKSGRYNGRQLSADKYAMKVINFYKLLFFLTILLQLYFYSQYMKKGRELAGSKSTQSKEIEIKLK